MNHLAIIGGSGFKDFQKKGVIFLQRHGRNTPPHMIDHKKNILSLKKKGVRTIISVCSVGSLKKSLNPGSIVIPHDYINLKNILTYLDIEAKHITPEIDDNLRKKIIDSAKNISLNITTKAVYIQTIGPRLETKAEINMIKNYADIVGMTMANEATLTKELGIRYAAICSVDNYANGISDKPLNIKDIKNNQKKNEKIIMKLLKAIL